jgi:hypothetical protein
MKTYVFTIHPQKSKNLNRFARVYRLKNNNPVYLGFCEWSTSSCRGSSSEVFNFLIGIGELPKSLFKCSLCDWRGSAYYCREVEEKGYKIISID